MLFVLCEPAGTASVITRHVGLVHCVCLFVP